MGSNVGGFLHEGLPYEFSFLITMSLAVGDRERNRQQVELRAARAVQNASSIMAQLMSGHYERQRDDWAHVSSVLKGGGLLAHVSHHVLLYARPGESAGVGHWRDSGGKERAIAAARDKSLVNRMSMYGAYLAVSPGWCKEWLSPSGANTTGGCAKEAASSQNGKLVKKAPTKI